MMNFMMGPMERMAHNQGFAPNQSPVNQNPAMNPLVSQGMAGMMGGGGFMGPSPDFLQKLFQMISQNGIGQSTPPTPPMGNGGMIQDGPKPGMGNWQGGMGNMPKPMPSPMDPRANNALLPKRQTNLATAIGPKFNQQPASTNWQSGFSAPKAPSATPMPTPRFSTGLGGFASKQKNGTIAY